MEDGPYSNKNEEDKQKNNSDYMSGPIGLDESVWVRCGNSSGNELDKLLLDYYFYFLPVIGFIFWIVFLFS